MPEHKIKQLLFKFITNKYVDSFVMVVIFANIVTLAMPQEGASDQYNLIIEDVNLSFTAVFIIEFLIKITALGVTT